MQTFGETAARLRTAREFIDDDDLVVLHDVVDVDFEQTVGAQQLRDVLDDLRLLVEIVLRLAAFFDLLVVVQRVVRVDFGENRGEVRNDEGVLFARAEEFAAHGGEVGLVALLVDGEIHGVLHLLEEAAVVVAMKFQIFFIQRLADGGVFHETHQLLVLRHAQLDFRQQRVGLILLLFRMVRLVQNVLRLLDPVAHELHLAAVQFRDGRFQLVVHVRRFLRGTRDDQRRTGLVDQNTVDFIDDGVVVVALDEILLAGGHAHVAQVVEAEFAVRAVGDVAVVLFAPLVRSHAVLDAADRDAEPFEHMAHPFRVAPRQIVVDGDELDVASRQGVQIQRHDGDERLSFTGRHFGDVVLVQRDGADELHVERNHVPRQDMARDLHLRAHQAAAGVLHDGVGLAEEIIRRLAFLQAFLELGRLRLQLFIRQRMVFFIQLVDARDQRLNFLQHSRIAAAKNLFCDPS